MNTRSRAESTLINGQALAPPVLCAEGPRHVSYPASFGLRGTGSHAHLRAPVRASNARTTPAGDSERRPSATVEPTMRIPLTTAGGDVIEYSPVYAGAFTRS